MRRREEALEGRIAKAGEELEMLQAALDEKVGECSEYCTLVNIQEKEIASLSEQSERL